MPKKQQLTPEKLKALGQQLHSTRIALWEGREALNLYLRKDTEIVQKAFLIYDQFVELERMCEKQIGTNYRR